MGQAEHSKIINKVAAQVLKPAGLERKGRSRIWYDDHGWYTTVVEFQPHKWKHGAFLNVGVNFHWYEQDYVSYDIGYRETGFEEFSTAQEFQAQIEAMVQTALEKVKEYRAQLPDLETAKSLILNYVFTSDNLWGNYQKGLISALTGDETESIAYFNALLEVEHDVPWANALKARTRELMNLIGEVGTLKEEIEEVIRKSRANKKLKELEIALK